MPSSNPDRNPQYPVGDWRRGIRFINREPIVLNPLDYLSVQQIVHRNNMSQSSHVSGTPTQRSRGAGTATQRRRYGSQSSGSGQSLTSLEKRRLQEHYRRRGRGPTPTPPSTTSSTREALSAPTRSAPGGKSRANPPKKRLKPNALREKRQTNSTGSMELSQSGSERAGPSNAPRITAGVLRAATPPVPSQVGSEHELSASGSSLLDSAQWRKYGTLTLKLAPEEIKRVKELLCIDVN